MFRFAFGKLEARERYGVVQHLQLGFSALKCPVLPSHDAPMPEAGVRQRDDGRCDVDRLVKMDGGYHRWTVQVERTKAFAVRPPSKVSG